MDKIYEDGYNTYKETIKSTQQLIDLSKEFDEEYQTSTYRVQMTFHELWHTFYNKTHFQARWCANTIEEYTHAILSNRVNMLFGDGSNVHYSNDGSTNNQIGKFNSLYLFKKDVQSGIELKDPVSVSVFDSHGCDITVHPGGTRLMVANQIDTKVDVILTVYKGAEISYYMNESSLEPLSETLHEFDKQPMLYVQTMSNNPVCKQTFQKTLNVKYDKPNTIIKPVKYLTDYVRSEDNPDYTYHRAIECDPPRKFELCGNAVYVDEEKVAYIAPNGFWTVNI